MLNHGIYVCPRGRGYWKEQFAKRARFGRYQIVSGRYVSFDKVVWC